MKLRGRFDNWNFSKKKENSCSPITKEHVLQEIKVLNGLLSFLPDSIETHESANLLKKTEDGQNFQGKKLHSSVNTL